MLNELQKKFIAVQYYPFNGLLGLAILCLNIV